MKQTKLSSFLKSAVVRSKEYIRKVHRRLLYPTTRRQLSYFEGECPTEGCSGKLVPISPGEARKFQKLDRYLCKFRLRRACFSCARIFVVPSTLIDLIFDFFDVLKLAYKQEIAKQQYERDQVELKQFGYTCPNPSCGELINLKRYEKSTLHFIAEKVILNCYHCNQIIGIPEQNYYALIDSES